MHYVYKIVNPLDEIEYIGETKNPNLKRRLWNHTCKHGKFTGRIKEIKIELIKECIDKQSALNLQEKLQRQFGFEIDRDVFKENMKIARDVIAKQRQMPFICYDTKGNFIREFDSLTQAKDILNLSSTFLIWRVLNKIQTSTKGYYFEYKKTPLD